MDHVQGFRFCPEDHEIVGLYLYFKLVGASAANTLVNDINIYDYEPWMLQQHSKVKSRDSYWFFFTPSAVDQCTTQRTTELGFWKKTGKNTPIYDKWGDWTGNQGAEIGCRKTLRFHMGRAVNRGDGEWMMYEYHNTMVPQNLSTHVMCKIEYKGTDIRYISDNTTEAGPSNSAGYEVNYVSTNEIQHFSGNLNTQEQQVVVPALNTENEIMQMPCNYLEEDLRYDIDEG